MPTPLSYMNWNGEPHLHLTMHDPTQKPNEPLPPHPLSQFWVVDNGNANIRHVRSTLRAIPATGALAKQANLPLALILRPLGPVGPSESTIPEVDATMTDGPLRCRRCKGYANCWDRFIDSGRTYLCSLCEHKNEVPMDKFVPVDATGKPIDPHGRPEYTRGSVSWAVSGSYVMKAKGPLSFVLLLDVSQQSIISGVLQAATFTVNHLLDNLHPDSPLQLGIITFDETIHFYDLSPELKQPRMMLVSDLLEVFLPAATDRLVVNAMKSRHVIKSLLESLPKIFGSTTVINSCFGAAATAARQLLEETGGKIVAVQTTMPNHGPGGLQPRPKNLNPNAADKAEAALFQPQIPFYTQLAETCAQNAVGVDLMTVAAHSSSSFDLPSILPLVNMTGGESHYYVVSEAQALETFSRDLLHVLSRDTAYDCHLRVRSSLGIDVNNYYGSCYIPDRDAAPDVVVPVFHSDKTMVVDFTYESGFKTDVPVVFQCALLYTNSAGRRIVTVHTVGLYSTAALPKVYRMTDITAVTLVNNYISSVRPNATDHRAISDTLTEQTVDVLHKYRVHCSNSSPAKLRNLVLPESLKLLPIYTMATLRSIMFRHTPNSRAVDERAHFRTMLRHAPIETLLLMLYPRMMSLHNIPSTLAIPDEFGFVVTLPPLLPLRTASFEDTGLYLLDNGVGLYMYIGKNINSELFRSLFASQPGQADEESPNFVLRPPGTSDIANRVHAIIATLSLTSPTRFKPLRILNPGSITDNHKHLWMIEERLNEVPSYVDFLCNVHRAIQLRSK